GVDAEQRGARAVDVDVETVAFALGSGLHVDRSGDRLNEGREFVGRTLDLALRPGQDVEDRIAVAAIAGDRKLTAGYEISQFTDLPDRAIGLAAPLLVHRRVEPCDVAAERRTVAGRLSADARKRRLDSVDREDVLLKPVDRRLRFADRRADRISERHRDVA